VLGLMKFVFGMEKSTLSIIIQADIAHRVMIYAIHNHDFSVECTTLHQMLVTLAPNSIADLVWF